MVGSASILSPLNETSAPPISDLKRGELFSVQLLLQLFQLSVNPPAFLPACLLACLCVKLLFKSNPGEAFGPYHKKNQSRRKKISLRK